MTENLYEAFASIFYSTDMQTKMIPGLTRGAFKTLIMLGAGIFLLTEISNELRLSSKNGVGQIKNVHKQIGKHTDLARKKEELDAKEVTLNNLEWISEAQKIVSGDKSLAPLFEPFSPNLDQDDPKLIQAIRDKYLIAPTETPYNIQATKETSLGQAQLIRRILKNKKNGVFIECAANDGETHSNTLFLEMELDWSGILIEVDPRNLKKLKSKNRKSWLVPSCLSTMSHTMSEVYGENNNDGKIVQAPVQDLHASDDRKRNEVGMVSVSCLPLYSIIQAFNNPSIDYLSLNVEGSELAVLKTIPFDMVDIKIISVGFSHLENLGLSNEDLKRFMEDHDYVYHSTIKGKKNLANDFIFVKKHFQI